MPFKMDAETAKIVTAGRGAWGKLKKQNLWSEWVTVGRAIQAGKAAMMTYLQTDNPIGRQWSEQFGKWLEDNQFAEIDAGVRNRLEKCMDHLADIEAWRATLGLEKWQEYNHPNTVWRHFAKRAGVSDKKPRTRAAKGEPELARETQELNDQVRQLINTDDLHFDLSSPEMIATSVDNFVTFYEHYGDAALIAFARLLEEVASEHQRGRSEALMEHANGSDVQVAEEAPSRASGARRHLPQAPVSDA